MRRKLPRCRRPLLPTRRFRCARCGYGAVFGLDRNVDLGRARCVHLGELLGVQHHAHRFAALDASRARTPPFAGTVTVTSAFERLFIDSLDRRGEPAAVGFDYHVIHNVVVGGNDDFAGGLVGDDDLDGACGVDAVEGRGLDGACDDDRAPPLSPLPKKTDGAAMQTRNRPLRRAPAPSKDCDSGSIFFMVVIF